MSLSKNKILRIIARILQILVGGVFIFASTIKALNPSGFADQIASFHLVPAEWSLYLAWILIAAEFLLAVGLIVNSRPKIFIPLMMLVLITFIGVTIYTIVQGIEADCGCFGNVAHRSAEQVILEDALMLFSLLFAYIILRHDTRNLSDVKSGIILGAGFVIIVGITIFHEKLPVDTLVTELREGRTFTSWPTENLFIDLNSDRRLVFLFSTNSPRIEEDIRHMNEVAQAENLPQVVGLIIDGSSELNALIFEYGVAFPVGAIEPRFAKNLYRRLPVSFLLDGGTVVKVWNGIPQTGSVRSAVGPM